MRMTTYAVIAASAIAVLAGALAGPPVAAPVAAAATTIYVDPVTGNDSGAGTSENAPWRSLAKVNATVWGPGTSILLKAGTTFVDQYLDLRGSGAAGAPISVGKYGAGARPIINFGNTSVGGEGFGVRVTNGSHWSISDLEITSGQFATSMRRNGILIVGSGSGGGAFSDISIVNNVVHDVFGKDRRTGGINIHARQSAPGDPESTWDNVLIQGNTVTNVADTGIQTMTDAYTTGSSWTHTTDAFTHLVVRRNTVSQIHRDGILVRAGVNPLVEYNTADRIGKYTTADTATVTYLPAVSVVAAQWAYYTSGAVFQYNEASRTRRIDGDGQPWDFDVRVTNSVYQYNFSHDNEGGVLLTMNETSGNTFRYNVSQNDFDLSHGAFSIPLGAGSLAVYNNVIYRSQGQTGLLTTSNSSGLATYTNNVFFNGASGTYAIGGGASYSNNTFYGANATVAPDPARITSDPLFAAPGSATSLSTVATAYALGSGSTSRDSGVAIASNGGLDLAGRGLYSGVPDRGALEGGAAAVLVGDTFENGLLGGWAAISGSWVVGGSPGALTQGSVGGEAIASAGSMSWTDYTITARVAITTAGGNAGILFRYSDVDNFMMLRIKAGSSSVDLYKKVGGVLTLVASQPYSATPGRLASLRADVRGSAVDGWIDGAKVISWSDPTTQLTTGKVGVRTAASAAMFDEVVVRG